VSFPSWSQPQLREYVRSEAADGWSDPDFDPDDYQWSFEQFPTKILLGPGGKRGWKKWYDDERMLGDRSYEYWDKLERAWIRNPEKVGEIIVAERSPHDFAIGDGWHRTAIAVIFGMPVMPAIVGRRT
jgi:hypothetical protein